MWVVTAPAFLCKHHRIFFSILPTSSHHERHQGKPRDHPKLVLFKLFCVMTLLLGEDPLPAGGSCHCVNSPSWVLDPRTISPAPITGEYIRSKWFCHHVPQMITFSHLTVSIKLYDIIDLSTSQPGLGVIDLMTLFFSFPSLFCSTVNSHFIRTAGAPSLLLH